MKLCLDPGHGMSNAKPGRYDTGAQAGGVAEADVALAWALTLKWVLARAGIAYWLTRDDDSDDDPVSTRDNRAQSAGCTHFLSIHGNAGAPAVSGVETFYRDAADKAFAKLVHAAALEATGLPDRGVRPETQTAVGRLAVMNFKGPCALLEVGYITNARDRAVMQDRQVRLAFAEALARRLK